MQEKEKTKIKKRITRKKTKTTWKIKGIQQPKGTIVVIFSGVPGFRSKHQDKLALRSIIVASPAVPIYLNWSQYPI
jgi:hypothetical protein